VPEVRGTHTDRDVNFSTPRHRGTENGNDGELNHDEHYERRTKKKKKKKKKKQNLQAPNLSGATLQVRMFFAATNDRHI
jgi:hypothetical protein